MSGVERGPALAQLFGERCQELTELAVVAGRAEPADALVEAFVDLYEGWKDIADPLAYLRRRAIEAGTPERRPEVLAWLRTNTDLDDAAIADVAGMSPAELASLGRRP